MLLERRNSVSASEINQHIKQSITDCFSMPTRQSQRHMHAQVFPSGSDIPDNRDSISLGVINYEWFTQEHEGRLPAITHFYRNSPAGGGPDSAPVQEQHRHPGTRQRPKRRHGTPCTSLHRSPEHKEQSTRDAAAAPNGQLGSRANRCQKGPVRSHTKAIRQLVLPVHRPPHNT